MKDLKNITKLLQALCNEKKLVRITNIDNYGYTESCLGKLSGDKDTFTIYNIENGDTKFTANTVKMIEVMTEVYSN